MRFVRLPGRSSNALANKPVRRAALLNSTSEVAHTQHSVPATCGPRRCWADEGNSSAFPDRAASFLPSPRGASDESTSGGTPGSRLPLCVRCVRCAKPQSTSAGTITNPPNATNNRKKSSAVMYEFLDGFCDGSIATLQRRAWPHQCRQMLPSQQVARQGWSCSFRSDNWSRRLST
jgi:hypothetical protein